MAQAGELAAIAGGGIGLVTGARTLYRTGDAEIQSLSVKPLGESARRLADSAVGGVSLTTAPPNRADVRAFLDAQTQGADPAGAALAYDAAGALDQDSADAAALARLRRADEAVRQEERAHAANGGALAGPPIYETRIGPDGRPYAVAGSVRISGGGGDAEQAAQQAGRIRAAALAPNAPSAQDGIVAAQAGAEAAAAERRAGMSHVSLLV